MGMGIGISIAICIGKGIGIAQHSITSRPYAMLCSRPKEKISVAATALVLAARGPKKAEL